MVHATFTVTVNSAKNLPKADLFGKIDSVLLTSALPRESPSQHFILIQCHKRRKQKSKQIQTHTKIRASAGNGSNVDMDTDT